jgi:phosphoadenosine phosphosulfate reductase
MNYREWEQAKVLAETWSAEEVLEWAFQTFGTGVEIASGFGAEGVALIDMSARLRTGVRVFVLDTGFLFPETYALISEIEERYGIRIERVQPAITLEQQAQQLGAALWKRNPDQCCHLRKVEPLRKKLSGLQAWIAAIRREQTPDRAHARKLEWDTKFGLVKVNPIADWTADMVWEYIRANDVPYNPLHDRNYPSIGCTHCTRPVALGEEPRAGRWSGLAKTECGLHGGRAEAAPVLPIFEMWK